MMSVVLEVVNDVRDSVWLWETREQKVGGRVFMMGVGKQTATRHARRGVHVTVTVTPHAHPTRPAAREQSRKQTDKNRQGHAMGLGSNISLYATNRIEKNFPR